MAMGSTGTVNMTHQMFNDMKAAIDDYRSKSSTLAGRLREQISGLPANFTGAASEGFIYFADKLTTEAAEEGITNLLGAMDDMAEGILKAIPGGDGLDDQLGEGNRQ